MISETEIMIAIGDCLKNEEFTTWQKVQKFISSEVDKAGYNPSKKSIADVMDAMVRGNFLNKHNEKYTYSHKEIRHETVIKQVMPIVGGGLPDWSPEDDFPDEKDEK